MKRSISLMLCTVIAMLNSCGNIVGGGGGDDFPNSKVVGSLFNTDMTPAARTTVCLIPDGYDPVSGQPVVPLRVDTTDAAGNYSFLVAGAGRFNIQAKQLDSGNRAFISDIRVAGGAKVMVPTTTLRPSGAIRVTLPATVDTVNGYIYIPGTLISCFIHFNSGSIVLDSLPAGTLPALYYMVRNIQGVTLIRYKIEVVPGDTVVDPGWGFSREIYLNTTSSGAQVAGNVVAFPVLVRLTGANFDFASAKSGGADLWFAKSDDTPFPYEIEQWDSAASRAAVWVLVDTVFGNNGIQHFMMYWGNVSAAGQSNPAAVFDTARGFQGTWHLAEAGNSVAKDATANHYDGTPSGMTAASAVDGMIGGAQEFDGASSCFVMAGTAASSLNFPENGTYTVSAWVYTDTLDGVFHTIVSKGDKQYSLETMRSSNSWEFAECKSTGGWEVTSAASSAKTWAYLTGIRDGARQYLYVNGVCVDTSITLWSLPDSLRATGSNFTVGKQPEASTYFFNGKIDEVCASGVARSPDWIRLCYMNQKAVDWLVVIK